MVMVILTDAQPAAALQRLFSRISFVLFPLSIVFIKYTSLGVSYDEQGPHYTGVTTNKNALGLMLYILTIGIVWNIRTLVMDKKSPNRIGRLVAQVTILAFGIVLLRVAHSATGIFCFSLGGGLMLATGMPIVRKRTSILHVLCFGIFVLGLGGLFFGGSGAVASAMGRTSDFSGRTEIWAAAIASEDSQWIGTGFESFWNKNNPKVVAILQAEGYADIANLNSAHNGYLQIYLDLGCVGVCLLLYVLATGYLRVVKAFRINGELGSLFLAYLMTCAFYSITEAGFRIMTLTWIFLLLAVVGATGVNVGRVRVKERGSRIRIAPAAMENILV
jgi:O-antigen ligase